MINKQNPRYAFKTMPHQKINQLRKNRKKALIKVMSSPLPNMNSFNYEFHDLVKMFKPFNQIYTEYTHKLVRKKQAQRNQQISPDLQDDHGLEK